MRTRCQIIEFEFYKNDFTVRFSESIIRGTVTFGE